MYIYLYTGLQQHDLSLKDYNAKIHYFEDELYKAMLHCHSQAIPGEWELAYGQLCLHDVVLIYVATKFLPIPLTNSAYSLPGKG